MASKIVLRSLRNITSIKQQHKPISQLLNSKLTFPLITNQVKTFKVSTGQHNAAYKNLTAFLNEEIKLESEAHKSKSALPTIKGFETKSDGPNVTLTKTHNDETIVVKFNVNHTIGDDAAAEDVEPDVKEAEAAPPMKSRPTFNVDIKRNNKTLSFWCSFLGSDETTVDQGEEQREDFQIDEFAIHDGEWNDNVYTVDCTVLDGNLYDLLLSLLDERGIGEEFANNLMELSTTYEHKLYIDLLEKLREFSK